MTSIKSIIWQSLVASLPICFPGVWYVQKLLSLPSHRVHRSGPLRLWRDSSIKYQMNRKREKKTWMRNVVFFR
jgi:hypothetical protein